jgi:hypothetical protein
MNYTELFQALMLQLGYKPSAQQIADIIGLSRQSVYTRSQRLEQKFTLEELLKIEQALKVELVNKSFKMDNISLVIPQEKTEDIAPEQISEELKGKYAKINYWDGCSINQEKIINPLYTELIVDLQRVINVWNCNPSDLCIIAMPGDEMNGGCYPIKNNDLLIIDKSQTDISSAGIYFYTTNNHSCVFVRRVMEKMKGHYMFTCDNQNYSVLNSTYSMQELEEMDFKVIGRFVANESFRVL